MSDFSYPHDADFATSVIGSLTYAELLAALIKAGVIEYRLYTRDQLEVAAYKVLLQNPEGLDCDILALGSNVTNSRPIYINELLIPPGILRGRVMDFYPTMSEVQVHLDKTFRDSLDPLVFSGTTKILKLSDLIKYDEEDGNDDDSETETGGVEDSSVSYAALLGYS